MVLVLRPEEIAGLLTMREMIDAVREGFRQWQRHTDFSDGRWLGPGVHLTSIVVSNIGLKRAVSCPR